MVKLIKPAAVLLDVEGTTTSKHFWSEKIVPFLRHNMKKCLEDNWKDKSLVVIIKELRAELREFREEEHACPSVVSPKYPTEEIVHSVVKVARFFLDRGASAGFLPSIQHLFVYAWMYGYKVDKLKGHVFKDVADALNEWHQDGVAIYVISSGQINAQKLLFAHSTEGALAALINGFFDANDYSGKKDPRTYKQIAEKINVDPEHLLFLTDDHKEAEAATKADYLCILIKRKGNRPIPRSALDEYKVITSFEQLIFK